MKNFIKLLGVIALVAVIGFSMMGCGDPSNDERGRTEGPTDPNQNPNLTVPANPSDIPNFPASKGYTAITEEEVQGVVTQLESFLDELVENMNDLLNGEPRSLSSKSNSFGRAVYARAVETYSFDGTLNEFWSKFLGEELGNLPEEVKLSGYIKGTVGFNDSEENPFPLTANGSAEFKVELLDGFALWGSSGGSSRYYDPQIGDYVGGEEYRTVEGEAIGFVAGTASVNNVKINSEDSMSGSVSYTVNYAVNIAFVEEGKWVKLIGKITVTANLNNQTVLATATFNAYGDSATPLVSKTYTVTANMEKVTVTK